MSHVQATFQKQISRIRKKELSDLEDLIFLPHIAFFSLIQLSNKKSNLFNFEVGCAIYNLISRVRQDMHEKFQNINSTKKAQNMHLNMQNLPKLHKYASKKQPKSSLKMKF